MQTSALPLGYAAMICNNVFCSRLENALHLEMERETGFEPATSTLARLHSTTELLPRCVWNLYASPRFLSSFLCHIL